MAAHPRFAPAALSLLRCSGRIPWNFRRAVAVSLQIQPSTRNIYVKANRKQVLDYYIYVNIVEE